MCGIAGVLNVAAAPPPEEALLRNMLAMIRHRGPDEFGIYLDDTVGLGNARLSVIDLSGGQQPISNEDGSLWIVFNGEIFNYVELRPELEAKGHRFSTQCDTEVLLHLYEEYGSQCLERLNGQFAFAIWNMREQSLFLARDRLGVRPLFYTRNGSRLLFGSEIKAILADRNVRTEIDPLALEQVFTFWAPLSPRTIFRGIKELPPGHYLLAKQGKISIQSYWNISFDGEANESNGSTARSTGDYLEELSELLIDAVRIRLRADVPVGAYLSGGLDSSTIAAIIRKFTNNRLDTFSIAFDDEHFDESSFQRQMARFLGTEHQVVRATSADIARVFPEVVWHAEVPLTRTAPAPMFMLSKLVRECGCKVVLTGEGADEFLAGYDIFKEAKIRRFWAAQPDSTRRPLLFQRLYADIPSLSKNNNSVLAAFFRSGLTDVENPSYSHAVRWRNNRRSCRFFSDETSSLMAGDAILDQVAYPSRFGAWEPLEQAQFLEISIFLSQYLLSSQGDRMAMAHSVEGRFPFLDHRLVEFCNRLPARLKLRGLTGKYLLKKLAGQWLPELILQRTKRAYRAPIRRSFFNAAAPEYVREVMTPESLRATGLFKPAPVSQMGKRAEEGHQLGETDEMALAGIISTQLLHRQFVERFPTGATLSDNDRVKICRRNNHAI
jgi:asparagine synthase (glutamine-hydrolysing)